LLTPGPLFGIETQQILTAIKHCPGGHGVGRMAGKHLGERALAAAITTHHRMDLPGADGEIHSLENRLILHTGLKTTDLEQNRSVGTDHGSRAG
jgi:hypothetical protein